MKKHLRTLLFVLLWTALPWTSLGCISGISGQTRNITPRKTSHSSTCCSRPAEQQNGLICYTREEVAFLVGKKKAYQELKVQNARLRKEGLDARKEAIQHKGAWDKEKIRFEGCLKQQELLAKALKDPKGTGIPVWAAVALIATGTITGALVGAVLGVGLSR